MVTKFWENIVMRAVKIYVLKEIGCHTEDCIHSAQDRAW
jgi:hypothetical protein